MAKILVLNGPNLNLLGSREPGHYGQRTLAEITSLMSEFANDCGQQLSHLQSNAEHELIEAIHAASSEGIDYIIFNPAAFTHTSVALRDALLAVKIPFIEVHLSNIHGRDDFRRQSYFADIAMGQISGFGGDSYLLALQAIVDRMDVPEA